MDWQQKAAALDALAEIQICFRKPGDWYVHQGVEIKDGSILRGTYGNGETPETAILDHWKNLVEDIAQTPLYLVTRAFCNDRRAVRWNGYMWQDVRESKNEAA